MQDLECFHCRSKKIFFILPNDTLQDVCLLKLIKHMYFKKCACFPINIIKKHVFTKCKENFLNACSHLRLQSLYVLFSFVLVSLELM